MDNRQMEYEAELLIGPGGIYKIEVGEYLVHSTLEKGCVIRGFGLDYKVNIFIHDSLLPTVKDYFSETGGRIEPKYAKFGKVYVLMFRNLKAKNVIDLRKLEGGTEESENFFIFTKFTTIRHTYSTVLYDVIHSRVKANPAMKENPSVFAAKRHLEDFPHTKYSLHLPYKSKYSLVFTSLELKQPEATCQIVEGRFRLKSQEFHLLQILTAEGQVFMAAESLEELKRFDLVFRAKAKIALKLKCLLSLWDFDRITVGEHSEEFVLRLQHVDFINSSFFKENPLNNTYPRKDYRVKSIFKLDGGEPQTQVSDSFRQTPQVVPPSKPKPGPTVDQHPARGERPKMRRPLQASRYGFSLAATPFHYEEEIKHLQPHAPVSAKTELSCAGRFHL